MRANNSALGLFSARVMSIRSSSSGSAGRALQVGVRRDVSLWPLEIISCKTAIPRAASKINFKLGLTKRLLFILSALEHPLSRKRADSGPPFRNLSAQSYHSLRESFVQWTLPPFPLLV